MTQHARKGLSVADHKAQMKLAEKLRVKLDHESVHMKSPDMGFLKGAGYMSAVILTYLEKELGNMEDWPR